MGQFTSLLKNEGDIVVNLGSSGNDNGLVTVANSDAVHIVDSSFVKSVIDKEAKSADVVLSYDCTDEKCNFSRVLASIIKSDELKGLGTKQLSEMIVKTIDENPGIFPSVTLGGYIFQATGRTFLFVENTTKGVKEKSPRYGFVDLTEVRKKLLFEAMRQREYRHDEGGWKEVALGAFGGIALTSVCILIKKLK